MKRRMKNKKMSDRRPLSDVRPIGPFLSADDVPSDNSPLTRQENKILEHADTWYDKITEEGVKRKMMRNYIDGITDDDFPKQRIEKMLNKADL